MYSSNKIRETQNEHPIFVCHFDSSVVMNLKPIFHLCGVGHLDFDQETFAVS